MPRDSDRVEIGDINEQYLNEFLEALQAAINQMSADGERISYVTSKSVQLGKYMAGILDESWNQMRGMEIQAVGIASISYDEESVKLINMRNQGAMLSDPNVREGYMQGSVARGIEAAGSNAAGSMAGFMGVGVGMQAGGGVVGAASAANQQQMQRQAAAAPGSWTCACGGVNSGAFCSACGKKKPEAGGWTCACGEKNSGAFCSACGKPKPEDGGWTCSLRREKTAVRSAPPAVRKSRSRRSAASAAIRRSPAKRPGSARMRDALFQRELNGDTDMIDFEYYAPTKIFFGRGAQEKRACLSVSSAARTCSSITAAPPSGWVCSTT